LQALALLIFEAIQRRQQSMLKFAISLGITLVLTGLYYLLRNPEYFAEGSLTLLLNNWYWLVAVGIMILIRMIGYGFIEEVEL
jgi:protein-S-isoprenylcysteine O-methyltransferase Ste14